MPQTAIYIYCLVGQPGRPAFARVPAGLPGATPPEVLPIDRSLWAVAAEVPLSVYGGAALEAKLTDLEWVAAAAVAHEAVVEAFARRPAAAVVPMKLLTRFSTRERAAAQLRRQRRSLTAILARVRGCREWGVRVTRCPADTRVRTPARTGTAFLRAKLQAREDARGTGACGRCRGIGVCRARSRRPSVPPARRAGRGSGAAARRCGVSGSGGPHRAFPRRRPPRRRRVPPGGRGAGAHRPVARVPFRGAGMKPPARPRSSVPPAGPPRGPRPAKLRRPPPPRTARARPPARRTAAVLARSETSLLDVVDSLLNKGVVLNADVMLALADVDLVYLRLSALLVAADRLNEA
jgi:hypothetical protein